MNAVEPRPGGVATISAPDDAPATAEVAQPGVAQQDVVAEAVEPEDAAGRAEPDDAAGRAEPEDAAGRAEPEDAAGRAEPDDAAGRAEPEGVAGRAEPEGVAGEPDPLSDASDAPPVTEPAVAVGTPVTRRRSPLRRAAVVGALTVVAALAVSAFATGGPAGGDADQHFVDTARLQGHTVVPGDQQTLIVSAARKICERKESHSTIADRRATALSSAELGAVTTTFDHDARGFTELALQTYCAR